MFVDEELWLEIWLDEDEREFVEEELADDWEEVEIGDNVEGEEELRNELVFDTDCGDVLCELTLFDVDPVV